MDHYHHPLMFISVVMGGLIWQVITSSFRIPDDILVLLFFALDTHPKMAYNNTVVMVVFIIHSFTVNLR